MARKSEIKPSDVTSQFEFDIAEITDFCADVLEDANDHNVSLALRALNAGDYELSKEFVDLEAAHVEAGELTPELAEKRHELEERLDQAEGAVDESEEPAFKAGCHHSKTAEYARKGEPFVRCSICEARRM